MRTYQLQDFANPISVAVTNPSQSGYSRFVGLEHYDSGELVVKRYSGTELLTTTAKAFETNDILIARRNVYLKRAGIVFFDGITSGDTIVLRIKNDCESTTGVPKDLAQRIIPIVLNSEHFWIYANKHADGMNSKRISKEMLLTYEFELPSLEEQRVLADKLWAAYEVKESYKNLLVQTDKLLHAQFQKMFGDIEKTVPLKTCANVITGSTPSKSRPEYWNNGTYYWVSAFDMKEKYIKDTLEKVTQKGYDTCRKLPIGSILYVCRGSIGVMAINSVECACNQSICAATCHENWDNEFIYYVLKYCSENIQKQYGEGTSFKSISQSTFMNLPIPDVPYNVQVEFREFIEQAELTKASLNKGIEAIEAVIRSLIAEGTTKV